MYLYVCIHICTHILFWNIQTYTKASSSTASLFQSSTWPAHPGRGALIPASTVQYFKVWYNIVYLYIHIYYSIIYYNGIQYHTKQTWNRKKIPSIDSCPASEPSFRRFAGASEGAAAPAAAQRKRSAREYLGRGRVCRASQKSLSKEKSLNHK